MCVPTHYIALQQSEAMRATFMAEISAFQPEMMLWIDETGYDKRNMLRKYGNRVRGTPAHDFVLRVGGKRYSAITIMSMTTIQDVYINEGSVNGSVFIHFIRCTLLPLLMPFDGINPHSVVILDNASIHHVAAVQELINSVGALVKFLPQYSPDLMPLEEVFAEVKQQITDHNHLMQSTEPTVLITQAFSSVSVSNCLSYVRHAGYIL